MTLFGRKCPFEWPAKMRGTREIWLLKDNHGRQSRGCVRLSPFPNFCSWLMMTPGGGEWGGGGDVPFRLFLHTCTLEIAWYFSSGNIGMPMG